MSLTTSILEYVAKYQAVSIDHLNSVDCVKMDAKQVHWASEFFVKSHCFSNALNMSMLDECDVVLGYVYSSDDGIAIEHAWNAEGSVHYDLTSQLFWGSDADNVYVQLLRLSANEAMSFFESNKGVDHMALRNSPKYKYLFGR